MILRLGGRADDTATGRIRRLGGACDTMAGAGTTIGRATRWRDRQNALPKKNPALFALVCGGGVLGSMHEADGDERGHVLVGQGVDDALSLAARGHEAAVAQEPELM